MNDDSKNIESDDSDHLEISDEDKEIFLSILQKMMEMGFGAVYGQEDEEYLMRVWIVKRNIARTLNAARLDAMSGLNGHFLNKSTLSP